MGDVVFVLTAGRAAERRVNGVSVVEFEDAMERYRKRRLTAEGEAGAFTRVGFACLGLSGMADRDMGTRAIGEVGGHDGCRFGRVF